MRRSWRWLGAVGLAAALVPAGVAWGGPPSARGPGEMEVLTFVHFPPAAGAKPARAGGGGGCPSRTVGVWPTTTLTAVASLASPSVTDPASFFTGLADGFGAWDAASGLVVSLSRDDTVRNSTFVSGAMDGVNEVTWEDLSGTSPGAIAVTWVWRNRATKLIAEADVAMNTQYAWTQNAVAGDPNLATGDPGKMDVQDIATHEFGHVVGLDHVQESAHTMYPFAAQGEVKKRSLECGDVAGVQKLYGPA